MKLLILGGTIFLGRHLVEAARARGHEVTLFNRGQHNADLFPDVEKLRGDRDGGLDTLHGRRWDAVIDTCGYVPRLVRASAEALADAVAHYTFISSVSVYRDMRVPGIDENYPVGLLEDETVEEVTGESYGPLKALCEQAAEQVMPGRVLSLRAGLIVGPYDVSDRFTYWPHRVAQGGEVLAPAPPEQPLQFIDVRDLAEWNIRMIEAGKTGVYNTDSPPGLATFGTLLDTCKAVSGSDARFTWVSSAFLTKAEVAPWMELSLWLGEDEEYAALYAVNCDKAARDGLTIRPLAETVQDTLAWSATRPADHEWRAGLKPEREVELLRSWAVGRQD